MRAQPLLDIIERFPGKRVLVVGDVMLDEYIWGDVSRISPEAPVPVVEFQRHSRTAGGAGNAAVNVAMLGAHVLLGGVVGKDREADHLCETLRGTTAIIDPKGLIVDEARVTTTKTRILAHAQQVVRLDREQKAPLPAACEDKLLNWAEREVGSVDICILSDYAKGVASPRLCRQLIKLVSKAGKPIIVDPKGTDYSKYQGATVVKPNALEVHQVLKCDIRTEADWLEAGEKLLSLLPGTSLLVSRGAAGMMLFQKDVPPKHIPSSAQEVFDVTGAGDTVVSTLALALASGATFEQAAQLATSAAAIVIAKVGTAAVTLPELQHYLALDRTP